VRSRWLVVSAIAVATAAMLTFVGLWAAGALPLGEESSGEQAQPRATTTSSTTRARDDTPPPCRTPLTPDDPLRLWIAGDSLAGSLGPSLGEQTAATGVVQPVYDSRVSSGLSTPDFFDWPEHAAEEITRLDPEVVVFIIGANDFKVASDARKSDSGEPAWREEYALQVEQMLEVLEQTSDPDRVRRVYWVSSPPMEDDRKDAGVQQVNAVARTVVAEHPDATYVDAYELFTGEDGTYTATLPDPMGGKDLRVRAGDGIHFTPEGGDLLGERVFEPLDALCDVEAQAVPGERKRVERTKGSTEVSGTNRGSAPAAPAPTAPPTLAPQTSPPTAPQTSPSTSAATTPSTSAATTPSTPSSTTATLSTPSL
jgi:uncharacterized protein